MAQTAHTPGPWKVDVDSRPHSGGKYRPDFWFVTGADGASFAKVEAWPDPDQRSEAEANARLIAAAPELLAALKEFVAGHDRVQGPARDQMFDAAFAAIAKAEGR